MVRSSVAAFPTFLFPECSGAMARGKIGKISNIDNGKLGNIALGKMGKSAQEQNVKRTVGNQRLKTLTKPPEKKKLKFHNVFFDKVMEIKQVQVDKELPKNTSSSKSKKRKANDELVIKEYNPTRRRNEISRKKNEGKVEEGADVNEDVTGAVPKEDKGASRRALEGDHVAMLPEFYSSTPLDLRTHTREPTPESGASASESPVPSSPETSSAAILRLRTPPPLEPLSKDASAINNSTQETSRRPFAEGFMWQLLCHLRQEAPKARKEGKASVPSG